MADIRVCKWNAFGHRYVLNKAEFNSQRFKQLERVLVVLRRQATRWGSGEAGRLTSRTDAGFSFFFSFFFFLHEAQGRACKRLAMPRYGLRWDLCHYLKKPWADR